MLWKKKTKLKKLIEELYTIDFYITDDKLREILSYREEAIPYLVDILNDTIENFDYYSRISRYRNDECQENKEGRISHMRNPAFPSKLPVPDVYRTFFTSMSKEIVDTIAAIQTFMAA